MGGFCCPSNGFSSSPILFFATSTETPNITLALNVPQDVLILGVSPPGPGQHQVKIDSTVELFLSKPAGTPLNYTIEYRLRKNNVTIANVTETKSFAVGGATTSTIIPNLTWNDTITTSVTYTVEIQVTVLTPAATTVIAQTRALNAIVF